MTPKEPSNSEIYEKLGSIEGKFQGQLDAILTQVKHTNGRVTRLEKWKDKLDVIADYKKDNGSDKISGIDSQKIIMYALGLLGTALAIILALSNGK